ncbi:hypothetical protein JG687_00016710 [Phytophthora cactorum]|uniref:Uncharacterized protein n=1 Tax=Phytophthora cactorum TaxID=29920 RepID=A0A8T1TTT8_9STRA|nr:hypothetical protein GQ600_19502 [Phytophthora cactorum]KAG6946433.1 hypothetical protein JG687_00016710 [Phytophthora cactorum]
MGRKYNYGFIEPVKQEICQGAGLDHSPTRWCPTSTDDGRTPCLRFRSGTGTPPDMDLTGDRCPRREEGAATEW